MPKTVPKIPTMGAIETMVTRLFSPRFMSRWTAAAERSIVGSSDIIAASLILMKSVPNRMVQLLNLRINAIFSWQIIGLNELHYIGVILRSIDATPNVRRQFGVDQLFKRQNLRLVGNLSWQR